jgi:ElaB/YqjD/DUF883 family membrane-anchored ribosome-binding protein
VTADAAAPYLALAACYRQQAALAAHDPPDVAAIDALMADIERMIAAIAPPQEASQAVATAIREAEAARREAAAALGRHRDRLTASGAAVSRQSAAIRAYGTPDASGGAGRFIDGKH